MSLNMSFPPNGVTTSPPVPDGGGGVAVEVELDQQGAAAAPPAVRSRSVDAVGGDRDGVWRGCNRRSERSRARSRRTMPPARREHRTSTPPDRCVRPVVDATGDDRCCHRRRARSGCRNRPCRCQRSATPPQSRRTDPECRPDRIARDVMSASVAEVMPGDEDVARGVEQGCRRIVVRPPVVGHLPRRAEAGIERAVGLVPPGWPCRCWRCRHGRSPGTSRSAAPSTAYPPDCIPCA